MKDGDLLLAAKKFDEEALRKIFDLYSSLIYNYALRLCGDSMEADNVVGDTFALLLEQFAKGKGPDSNLRSYLYQTAYRLIIDHSRERKRFGMIELVEQTKDEFSPVAYQAEQDLQMESLVRIMNTQLSPDQRHVLLLRFVEGFNVEETARIVGKSIANVKVIQNRGIEKLRRILGSQSD